jgi:hypothetical protein
VQERSISTPEIEREFTLTLAFVREHRQCKVTSLGEDKYTNGKRVLEDVIEAQITGNKERKINKNKFKLEKLQ